LARADQWASANEASSPFGTVVMATTAQAAGMTTIQENVIVKTNPADTQNFMRHGTTEYTVSSGDSIISIASSFGISPQTIMMENKLNETATLRPGQKLTILPTTGISHTVGKTETVESIASKYKVSEDDILDLNDIELAEDVSAGATLVIPLAKVELPRTTSIVKNNTNQIALKQVPTPAGFIGGSDFIWPTPVRTITQGFHRLHSGLDISNSHKESIYAAADGFVELSGWRAGYGNTVILNHGNGFKTLYGHSSELYVKAGSSPSKATRDASEAPPASTCTSRSSRTAARSTRSATSGHNRFAIAHSPPAAPPPYGASCTIAHPSPKAKSRTKVRVFYCCPQRINKNRPIARCGDRRSGRGASTEDPYVC
jgi:LysM repeat protein